MALPKTKRKTKRKSRKDSQKSTARREMSFIEDATSGMPTDPPEPPNVRMYGDPNYWIERYIQPSDGDNERDNTK
jgi:hypothetical protein